MLVKRTWLYAQEKQICLYFSVFIDRFKNHPRNADLFYQSYTVSHANMSLIVESTGIHGATLFVSGEEM